MATDLQTLSADRDSQRHQRWMGLVIECIDGEPDPGDVLERLEAMGRTAEDLAQCQDIVTRRREAAERIRSVELQAERARAIDGELRALREERETAERKYHERRRALEVEQLACERTRSEADRAREFLQTSWREIASETDLRRLAELERRLRELGPRQQTLRHERDRAQERVLSLEQRQAKASHPSESIDHTLGGERRALEAATERHTSCVQEIEALRAELAAMMRVAETV